MRTSRVSQDAAKIAALTSGRTTRAKVATSSATPVSTSKRISRSSKGVSKGTTNTTDPSPPQSLSRTPDIEDILSPPSLKRKRGTSTPTTPASVKTSRATRSSATPRKSPRKPNGSILFKEEDAEEHELDETLSERTRLPKAKAQPFRQVTDPDTGEVTVHPPGRWEELYDSALKMRKTLLAPVDTMGCERAADRQVSAKDQRFQTLIALMLSSQTKDTTLFPVMQKLRTTLPSPGLTLTNILALTDTPDVLNNLIWSVGFHNNKTRYILQTAAILRDKFDGDIPRTADELMSLPGVGPKMAYLCMSAAWDKTEGIGVDVHVHRITNLWGWHKTNDPEATRKNLQAWLPRDRWREINWLLVGLGQTVCTPVGRKCGDCELGGRGLCPGEVVDRKVKVVKKVEEDGEEVKVEEVDRMVNGETEVVVKEEVIV